MQSKTCTACNTKFYSLTTEGFSKYFQRASKLLDGFMHHCKKCHNEYRREYHKKNPHIRAKKPILNKNCIVCTKPFQTKRETRETCCSECAYIRKKAYSRIQRREKNINEKVKKLRAKEIKKASKQRLHYTKEEIEFIKANIELQAISKIAKKLNRTYYGVYLKAQQLRGKVYKRNII